MRLTNDCESIVEDNNKSIDEKNAEISLLKESIETLESKNTENINMKKKLETAELNFSKKEKEAAESEEKLTDVMRDLEILRRQSKEKEVE